MLSTGANSGPTYLPPDANPPFAGYLPRSWIASPRGVARCDGQGLGGGAAGERKTRDAAALGGTVRSLARNSASNSMERCNRRTLRNWWRDFGG